MTPTNLSLSVLLHRDGDAWFAQCLQFDVAAQGRTPEEARQRFLTTLTEQILLDLRDSKPPLTHLGPAPNRYIELSVGQRGALTLPVYVPAGAGGGERPSVVATFLQAA